MSRAELEKAVIKSATGPDETKHLLKVIDSCVAAELDASDSLLISEIAELELDIKTLHTELLRSRHDADQLAKKCLEQQATINQLKAAFKRD